LVVESKAYCLTCYRYIELNPVRAGMVQHPAKYRWSSFNFNALGETSDLLVPHDCWLALGNFKQQREEALSIKLRDGKRGRPKNIT